jgi:hypothetical protein
MILLYTAFGAWLVQQLNDVVNAYLNRKYVPKLFWLSAAASFISGAALFYYIFDFDNAVINTFTFVGKVLLNLS